MRKRVASILPIVTSQVLAVTALTTVQGVAVLAADDCITKPNLRANQGGHWYYHFDVVKSRKCWFLRQQGVEAPPVSLQFQSSADTVPQANSGLSSLLAFATGLSEQRQAPQGENSTDALRRDAVLANQQVALRYSHKKQPSTRRERSSSWSFEKEKLGERSTTRLDRASRDVLFREFLLWNERQSAVDAMPDETDREALFREFLRWNERQRSD
jgi:hypothetical protein